MFSPVYFAGVFGLFVIFAADAQNGNLDFGYHGMKGPEHWVDVLEYNTCVGKLQSPIDIQEHLLVPIRFPPLRFSGFHLLPSSCVLTNNGHTVVLELNTPERAILSGGPLKGNYVFSQLHFHWGANDSFGSEDLINSHAFAMELHMVFYKEEYGNMITARDFKEGLVVLAVFYEASDFENMLYSEIIHHLDKVTEPHTRVHLHSPLTLDSLLPSNKYHYYAYNGSLTTPPCSEVVIWMNFKEPIFLSHSQVAAFRHLRSPDGMLTENFRPVQPLEGRTVYYNVGERPFTFHESHIFHRGGSSALLKSNSRQCHAISLILAISINFYLYVSHLS